MGTRAIAQVLKPKNNRMPDVTCKKPDLILNCAVIDMPVR
jgi:hypothetical protein